MIVIYLIQVHVRVQQTNTRNCIFIIGKTGAQKDSLLSIDKLYLLSANQSLPSAFGSWQVKIESTVHRALVDVPEHDTRYTTWQFSSLHHYTLGVCVHCRMIVRWITTFYNICLANRCNKFYWNRNQWKRDKIPIIHRFMLVEETV